MLGRDGDACVLILVHSDVQLESDLSSPGGKARIIHKESDIITAFAINKVGFYTEVCCAAVKDFFASQWHSCCFW